MSQKRCTTQPIIKVLWKYNSSNLEICTISQRLPSLLRARDRCCRAAVREFLRWFLRSAAPARSPPPQERVAAAARVFGGSRTD